ncbi:MAG: putative LPS assembly protein LptD [Candidatus Eisenbacteria bacterium]
MAIGSRPALLVFCLFSVVFAAAARTCTCEEREPIPFDISGDNLKGKAGTDADYIEIVNPRIVHGSTTMTGVTGIYFRSLRMVTLGGGVKIVDGETVMTSRRATYSFETEVATLEENVVIRNKGAILESDAAELRKKENMAVVTGRVSLVDSTRRIDADRVVYHRDTEIAEAFGHVVGFDSENDATVTAGEAQYSRKSKIGVFTSDPRLVSRDKKNRETVVVSEQMEFHAEKSVYAARGSVHIAREDMQAECQLAEFFKDEERAVLRGTPRVWDEDGEMLGDSLELISDGDQIRDVNVYGNAEVRYRAAETEEPETSLVRGDSIRVVMEDEEVREVFVFGHAKSEYSSMAEGKPTRNFAAGDTIHLEVQNKKPSKATFLGGASGTYYFSTASADTFVEEKVEYSSRRLEFLIGRKLIQLSGDAELKYRNLRLNAQEVEFNSDRQTLDAAGDPILWENEEKVTGERMDYNLENSRGTIYEGRTRFEKGFYTGHQIRKVGDKILNVRTGEYTTCELKEPHYSFRSSRMKIYLNDKVIAKPLILFVKGVPVLALPFYVFPIKPGRHSGFLIPNIEFGINSNRGRFVRNAGYYWAVNDYSDVAVWADYFEREPRWIAYLESRYHVRYKLSGSLNSSYSKNVNLGRSQWDLQGRHYQKLGEDLDLTMSANFVSDKSYRLERGLGRSFDERVNRILRSTMSVTKRWAAAHFITAYDRTDYMDTEPADGVNELKRLELRPSASVTFQRKAIGRKGKNEKDKGRLPWLSSTYLGLSSVVLSQVNTYEDGSERHTGMSTRLNLSDARKLLGVVNISPGISYTENWYDKDLLGDRYERSGVWSTSIGGSATLYRVFLLDVGPLSGIRHSFSPRLQFSYQPDFPQYSYTDTLGIRRSKFPSFGGISTSWSRRKSLSIGFENRFQAKLKWKGQTVRLNDFLVVNTETSYDFLYRERSRSQPLSSINTTVRLKPAERFSSELFVTHDPITKHLSSLGFVSYLTLSGGKGAGGGVAPPVTSEVGQPGVGGPSEASEAETEEESPTLLPWNAGLTFSYNRGASRADASYWLSGNANVSLTKNWRVQYSAHYDLKERDVISQTFSLYRDLHCWEAMFIRRFSGQRWEYYFKINIKAHKEIYMERGTEIR